MMLVEGYSYSLIAAQYKSHACIKERPKPYKLEGKTETEKPPDTIMRILWRFINPCGENNSGNS